MTCALAPTWRTGLLLATLLMSGCGAWQGVKDVSSNAARAVFVAKVKTMNLTIEGRANFAAAANEDEMAGNQPGGAAEPDHGIRAPAQIDVTRGKHAAIK